MKYKYTVIKKLGFLLVLLCLYIGPISQGLSQQRSVYSRILSSPQTLDVSAKSSHLTDHFKLEILESSQTVAALKPNSDPKFDFTPSELLETRSRDSLYHLGDINLMVRKVDEQSWQHFSTARGRNDVRKLPVNGSILAASDLAPTMGGGLPFEIQRQWVNQDGDLLLRFIIRNNTDSNLELGYVGIPMVFDNILHGKNLEQAHLEKVFYDPYIGKDAGYLQVVRLSGKAPVLLVIPEKNAGFEAYKPLLDDRTPRSITFEGFHDWVIHSKAMAETEWKDTEPWNEPTSIVLQPGQEHQIALKFALTDNVRNIEKTLIVHNRPVAIGFPGYVIPQDIDAKLYIADHKKIKSLSVYPEGAMILQPSAKSVSGKWTEYSVKANKWGRARLTLNYENGEIQTINYKVIKPEEDVIADFGRFLTNEQWYENESDLFGRHPSVISYDYDKKQKVLEDSRAWIAGLSDEAGAGSWLAAIMKQYLNPDPEELSKLRQFYHNTLWGGIQYKEGDKKFGVRKSMFYYEPEKMPEGTYSKDVNYGTWAAWNQEQAESTGRSYNYPHVAAAHWVMYRLARFYNNLETTNHWSWYLENAYHTSVAMVEQAPHYAQFGQMEGTVFLLILKDLQKEGMGSMAKYLEEVMKKRTDVWAELPYPFGSEMPWDSTGQEEVYMWTDYFGFDQKAEVTLNAILAYMPTVPNWGYNGSARRYWDFVYGGKLQRIERQLHHYGSALNAIPVLHAYHKDPADTYLLRVGYGGVLGGISNISQDGFGPAAFHSYPQTLEIDGYSGDYGSGFFGYAINSRTYILNDSEFGWQSFGGNLKKEGDWVNIDVKTAGKNAIFIAPASTLIQTDAGKIEKVRFNPINEQIELFLAPKNEFTLKAVLRIESLDSGKEYSLKGIDKSIENKYEIELENEHVKITLIR